MAIRWHLLPARKALASLDPALPLDAVMTYKQSLRESMTWARRCLGFNAGNRCIHRSFPCRHRHLRRDGQSRRRANARDWRSPRHGRTRGNTCWRMILRRASWLTGNRTRLRSAAWLLASRNWLPTCSAASVRMTPSSSSASSTAIAAIALAFKLDSRSPCRARRSYAGPARRITKDRRLPHGRLSSLRQSVSPLHRRSRH